MTLSLTTRHQVTHTIAVESRGVRYFHLDKLNVFYPEVSQQNCHPLSMISTSIGWRDGRIRIASQMCDAGRLWHINSARQLIVHSGSTGYNSESLLRSHA